MKKFLVLAVAILIGTFAYGQDAEKYVEPPIDFPNTPVKVALETVFLKTGVQYSIEVEDISTFGNVTLAINDRRKLSDVLSLILDAKNLQYTEDAAGVYHITKKEKPGTSVPRVTKLYALTYATAGELVRQMKTVLTKDGVVSVDVGTNSLIITDVKDVFEGIESLLKELDNADRKEKLMAIKTKLFEVTKKTDTELAIDAQYTNNGALNIGGGSLSSTVISGVAQRWFGTMFQSGSALNGGGVNGAFFGPFTYTPDSGAYKLEFEMLATQATTAVDMIAYPDVVVSDGTEAKVSIGSREPVVAAQRSQVTVTGTGVSIPLTYSYTYQDVNITLTVTPQSQRDGTISMQINPQMNQLAGYVTDIFGGSAPIIDTREVRTKLFVNNGGTIRLGGMLKNRTTLTENKVPILGDIPLLGILFKTTNPVEEKTDISLFVSPHIVDYAPPRCKDTPWISKYEVTVPGETDVLVDWKLDLPFGANGVFSYNIYRDVQPITDLTDRKPFASDINGESTSWMDMSRKRKGQTYYYVVTAINPSGMEQAIDPTGKTNAVITIPEK